MTREASIERQVAVLLYEAKTRPDAAAGLMALAADCLRNAKPMPEALAAYLANALFKSAKADAANRGDKLAEELMLKQSANAPVKGRNFDVLLLIAKHDAKVQSVPKDARPQEKELVSDVMAALDVSERTAKKRIKEACLGIESVPDFVKSIRVQ